MQANVISMKSISVPELQLAPTTAREYSIETAVRPFSIIVPDLEPHPYRHININKRTYKISKIVGNVVFVSTQIPVVGENLHVEISLPPASNDGRNVSNWFCNKLSIASIKSQEVSFHEKFTVGMKYRMVLLNPVLGESGIIPKDTDIVFICQENLSPTVLTNTYTEPGLIVLTFSDDLSPDDGYIYGISYDNVEICDNQVFIYTSEAGEIVFEYNDFVDIYGNPIENGEITVNMVPSVETLNYAYDGYVIKKKSSIDFEDEVVAEAYQWLKRHGIE